MTGIIITAIIALDVGLAFGAWWGSRERYITDQEWIDYHDECDKKRARGTAKKLLEGL